MQSIATIDERGDLSVADLVDPVPWWSFTKTVLAVAALGLVERGRLSLDEAVDGKTYSLAHLLRHEAGLPDYGGLPRYHEDVAAGRTPWPVADLLATLDADRLRYEPGRGWAYSNIGYLEVGWLIEQASGWSLGEALDRLVFARVGLGTARLACTPEDVAGVAMGRAAGYHPGWVYHGLVVGTVADAARLLGALLAGAIVKPRMLERMIDGRALPEHRSELHPDPAYGLGLIMSATDPLRHPIGHSGAGPGSEIAVYARGGRTCAVWAAAPSMTDPMTEVSTRLAKGRRLG